MKMLTIIFISIQLIIVANSKVLPELHLPCHRSDPNVQSCLLQALETLKPYLSTGIPKYKLVPVDPLNIPVLFFNRTLSDITSIAATLTNVRLLGFSSVDIDEWKIDLEKLVVEFTATHPWFYLGTEFKVAGKIVDTPVDTEGIFTGNFTDVRHTFKIGFKEIKKRGVKQFAVDEFKLNGKIAHARLNLTSKNPVDQITLNLLLTTFNQNEREILDLFMPLYGESMGSVLRCVLEDILSKVPAVRIQKYLI